MWWGPSWFGMPFWPIIMIAMMAFCIGMMVMMMRGGGVQPPWRRSPKAPAAQRVTFLMNGMLVAKLTSPSMRMSGTTLPLYLGVALFPARHSLSQFLN